MVDVLLRYEGQLADQNAIDFYDAARAIGGFQRSLALTTHLVLNGEIITQAPALKNAKILLSTPRPGSWEVVATIIAGAWALGTAPKDTPLGHLIHSVYDFIVTQTLGFPVDYNRSLYRQYQDELVAKGITPEKLDSLSEKIESSLADIHRPIVASKTADHAEIFAGRTADQKIRLGREFNDNSYDYIKHSEIARIASSSEGVISSYNINTFAGRMFVFDESRPIAFELEDYARTRKNIRLITTSLRSNAIERGDRDGAICLMGRKVTSSSGRLKGLRVSDVSVP